MLLKFKLDKDGFRFTNPADLIAARSIDYIKCHFDIEDSTWANTDAIVAVFKSATYNKHAETLLDSNNSCFIDPSVYKNGGTIQVKLIGDKYQNEEVISSTTVTSILEFTINENVILPVTTPSMYAIIIAELEKSKAAVDQVLTDIAYKLAHGELTGTGIQDVVYNLDGTVTITLTDNTVFTSAFSLKGEKGDSGVYYGSEEPTDPEIDVWIDPDGESSMEPIYPLIEKWLDEHPEATTTVLDNSLTTAKYRDDSVTTDKLADGSVTTPKIADGAVTPVKLDRVYATSTDLSSVSTRVSQNSSDIDSLDTQFQQFIAPTGEAPNPAEITNARVGADGVTYTTLGDAIRTQVTDLKSDLDILLPSSLISGGVIDYEGNIVTSVTGWSYTDYISVIPNTKIIVHTVLASHWAYIALYDENKSFIGGYNSSDGTTDFIDLSVVIPLNCKYIRCSCYNYRVDVAKFYIKYDFTLKDAMTEVNGTSDPIIFRNTIYNGSVGNSANAKAVSTGSQIYPNQINTYVYGASKIQLVTNRPLLDPSHDYTVQFSTFDIDRNKIADAIPLVAGNYNMLLDLPKEAYYVSWTIYETDSSGAAVTLRDSDFDSYKVITLVYYDSLASYENKSSIVHKLRNARNASNPLTLLHFSDIHGDYYALNRMVAFAEWQHLLVDEIICTGDMRANVAGEIASWWNSKVLTCIGNHDTATYDSETGYDWTALSMADRDAYYIAPFESNWDVVHTSGLSYYYKDYSTQKVRLIVMDGMLYNDNGSEASAQTLWLANLLADAITNNYHVIIAIHAPHGGAELIRCSFTFYDWDSPMPTKADCNTPQTVIDTVANAISNGLHFVGYIVGHIHQDFVWDAEGDKKQLMYAITTANTNTKAQWEMSGQDRSGGVDAFNLITIDTANTLVKIIRGGGADIDDHMRTRKAICFDYSTGEIVGEML